MENDLDVGSELFHYKYCPECKRAIYVNDETHEGRKLRMNNFRREIIEEQIYELEKEISLKQERLSELKIEFDQRYASKQK
uniref:hypothetical protein n=1 Tax=Priestia koreensis TaxID=284581 RepID=UPI003F4940BD